MSKLAQTDYPIHPILQRRWSSRAFAERAVEPEKILSILEAARWAASSLNEQPWSFIVATKENPAEFAKMLDCLNEGNQQWAKRAPVLMMVVTKQFLDRDHSPNWAAFHDIGLALGNFSAQATALDLHLCIMGSINRAKTGQVYHLPQGYEPVVAVALGYLGDPDSLTDEHHRQRQTEPRHRKALTEFVFSDDWGQVWPVVSKNE